jgi:XTP/dITP diphosphohydrolase
MGKLLIATHNQGKVREYKKLLSDLPLEVTYLDELGITEEVEETGSTFEENARLKASTYARMTGLLTWADDSGLEVDPLGGRPGVYSARYAGEGASDEDRYRKLLAELESVPDEARTARFRSVVAIATPDGRVWTTSGKCEGVIAREPRGSFGFGYDPVFYIPELGKMMAELPPEQKNAISHRGRASRKAKKLLRELLQKGEIPPDGA